MHFTKLYNTKLKEQNLVESLFEMSVVSWLLELKVEMSKYL